MASMYAVYHGPEGLKKIAERIHRLTEILAAGLEKLGFKISPLPRFDTIRIELGQKPAADILKTAEAHGMNFREIDDQTLGISLDETTRESDVVEIWQVFKGNKGIGFTLAEVVDHASPVTRHAARTSTFLTHKVFNSYHSETEMLRYIKRLESRDLSLTASMIPLGSCTMKLNAAFEMLPVSWPEFAKLHPFAPLKQARGYQILFQQLEDWLAEITGFAGISLQPNAGSQGEYAGLLVIRAWHESRGETHRNICLIPDLRARNQSRQRGHGRVESRRRRLRPGWQH